MRILLTGASGFIGTSIKKNFNEFEIYPVSLLKTPIEKIDFTGVHTIIHLAALVHQMKGAPDADYFKINSDLTYNLAQTAKKNGVKHFIFMSTVKVYGESTIPGNPWTEKTPCNPTDPYGKSKLDAENRINTLLNNTFSISIIRTPLVYGEGVKGNVLNLIKLVSKFNFLPLGGINNKRTMVYVENLTALIKKIIEKEKSGVFLAGDKTAMSTSELITLIGHAFSKKLILMKIPRFIILCLQFIKPTIIERLYGSLELDCTMTFQTLDFIPPFEKKEGIECMVKFYKIIL